MDKCCIGKCGEDIAVKYLKKKGYKILTRNFRYKHKEIDIICVKDKCLIFVEVKTRTSKKYGMGIEAVDNKKILNLYSAAEWFITAKNIRKYNSRFDVINIYINYEKNYIKHYIDVIKEKPYKNS